MSCKSMAMRALEGKVPRTAWSVCLLDESLKLIIPMTLKEISLARACHASLKVRLVLYNRTTRSPKLYI
jgi:hypothetical protein